jgi:drug/metabolite transporter (DMT)-like permease
MRETLGLVGVLVLLGAGWGLTQPLSKIVVATGHLPFGIIFWQFLIGALFLTGVQAVRRRPFRTDPPALFVYAVIAVIGTLIPNGASYLAYRHLPAGIMSILISTVPMIAFAIALALGTDRFTLPRVADLTLGLAGIVLIVAPEGSLSVQGATFWVLVALVAPALYACEANFVGSYGTAGLGAIQVLHGASALGVLMVLPLALVSGQAYLPEWPPAPADTALLATSVIHALCYSTYVWLVGRAGSTFAAQCSYLVTGCGVLWAIALLGERYSGWVWLAMILVLGGIVLVQPRPKPGLAAAVLPGENAPS